MPRRQGDWLLHSEHEYTGDFIVVERSSSGELLSGFLGWRMWSLGLNGNVAQIFCRSIEMVFAYLRIQQRFSFAVLGIPDSARPNQILAVCRSCRSTSMPAANVPLYTAER